MHTTLLVETTLQVEPGAGRGRCHYRLGPECEDRFDMEYGEQSDTILILSTEIFYSFGYRINVVNRCIIISI